MKTALSILLLAIVLLTAVAAGKRPPVVSVSQPEEVELYTGQTAQANWDVVIASGFHVQANPASQSYLIPTKLDLTSSGMLIPGDPIYPKGKAYRLNGDTNDLSTYEGTITIGIPLKADDRAKPGVTKLHGTLSYQACDAKMCLAPASVPIELTVRIVEKN